MEKRSFSFLGQEIKKFLETEDQRRKNNFQALKASGLNFFSHEKFGWLVIGCKEWVFNFSWLMHLLPIKDTMIMRKFVAGALIARYLTYNQFMNDFYHLLSFLLFCLPLFIVHFGWLTKLERQRYEMTKNQFFGIYSL